MGRRSAAAWAARRRAPSGFAVDASPVTVPAAAGFPGVPAALLRPAPAGLPVRPVPAGFAVPPVAFGALRPRAPAGFAVPPLARLPPAAFVPVRADEVPAVVARPVLPDAVRRARAGRSVGGAVDSGGGVAGVSGASSGFA